MRIAGHIYPFVMKAAYFVGAVMLIHAGIKWLFF